MRLKDSEISIIKDAFKRRFSGETLYLFGSRTDDSKKGGDIDLLIISENKLALKEILAFEVDLIKGLGEQKIDILNYKRDDNSPFLELILNSAVEL